MSSPSSRRLLTPAFVSASIFNCAPVYAPTAVMATVAAVRITVLRLRSGVVIVAVVVSQEGCFGVGGRCMPGKLGCITGIRNKRGN